MESGEAESVAPPSVCQQLPVDRKLDNARQLRGMFDASSNALQNTDKLPRGSPPQYLGNAGQKYACIVDADESTRPRPEGAGHKPHQDHITARGMTSFTHCTVLFTKFIPMPQALKIPKAKESSGKSMGKTGENPGMAADESQKQERSDRSSKDQGRKVHCASLIDLCHLKNSELEPQFQKYKGRIVLWSDIVKEDWGSYAVCTEQGSSASQMTAAKGMDIISRLPGCSGQAADAVSSYTQVKMEDAPTL